MRFLAGKLRDFKQMLLTGLSWNQKRIMAHAYFGRLYFFKVFWREKQFFNSCYWRKNLEEKKNDI